VRILWVAPRHGRGIVGGAEALVAALARRSAALGWRAEVATTCAVDHATWENALPEGTRQEDGLAVHRFAVGPRDPEVYARLHPAVLAGRASYSMELEWLAHSVWSPGLQEFLADTAGDYDLRVFAPYLFGTTVWGAQVLPAGSALLPCLHDEPYARLATVRAVVEGCRGCLWNAPGEERLTRRLYRVRDGGLVGMGFDPPASPARPGFGEARGLGRYLLYAGRLEEGKRVQVAVEHALRLAGERPDAPRLALMGHGSYRPPRAAGDRVVELGFLDEEDKRAAYADALAVVNPSHMESLSLVVMEAWLEGTPVLVAAGSEVMRDHVERSGGGIAFADYDGFRDGVARLLADEGARERMGAAGRAYALEEYGWPAVTGRLRSTVERLAA
jgi:glycosyltransferase involved in cell wall biosynthesis